MRFIAGVEGYGRIIPRVYCCDVADFGEAAECSLALLFEGKVSKTVRTVLEGWLNGPCKIHSTADTIPTHSLRACWVLRQVAKSGEDLLIKNTAEHHTVENNNTVLTVFETFASNNRR